jgi:hypothetical protein
VRSTHCRRCRPRSRRAQPKRSAARYPNSSASIAMSAVPQRAESARSVASCVARSRHKMQLAVCSFRISQNEPNFCSRLEQLTSSICEFRRSQRAASSSSRRTWRTRRARLPRDPPPHAKQGLGLTCNLQFEEFGFCKTNPILLLYSRYLGLRAPRIPLCVAAGFAGSLSALFHRREFRRVGSHRGSRGGEPLIHRGRVHRRERWWTRRAPFFERH